MEMNWCLNSSQRQKKTDAKTVHRVPVHRSLAEVKDPVSGSPCKKHIPIRYKASSSGFASMNREVLFPHTKHQKKQRVATGCEPSLWVASLSKLVPLGHFALTVSQASARHQMFPGLQSNDGMHKAKQIRARRLSSLATEVSKCHSSLIILTPKK